MRERALNTCGHCNGSLGTERYMNCGKCRKAIHMTIACMKCKEKKLNAWIL